MIREAAVKRTWIAETALQKTAEMVEVPNILIGKLVVFAARERAVVVPVSAE